MLSAVVLTKNEERNLENCLKRLSFADEILVIDDYSSDKTLEIAKKFNAKVFQKSLDGDFASQRNFGLSKAKGKWVLFVDADELVSENLKLEIVSKINNPLDSKTGYFIKRKTFFLGKNLKYGQARYDKVLRLAKRGAGVWKRKVHEYWDIEGRIDTLKNYLEHYTAFSLRDFIAKINFYSELHAISNMDEGKKSNLFKIIFYPPLKFLDNFVLKAGFLDGLYGFVFSLLMSFHSFLSWSKLWLFSKNKKSARF
jgi:glycosyltransferase involved in cell wall biosynthesis